MSSQNRSSLEKIYKLLARFSFLAALLFLAFLSILAVNAMTRLENIAPAEFRLLLEILKNRFFR